MVTEIRYTTIRRVLDDLLDHPMLSTLTLEQVVRHTLRFISKHGYHNLYQDKQVDIDIHDFRGLLPCDLISILQVKDMMTGVCLRSMTDDFPMGMREKPESSPTEKCYPPYIPPRHVHFEEPSFKTQGRVLFTSFPEGKVTIAYKAIPVDEDGFPLIIDNETYLDALEAYIKKQVFTVLFDTGKFGTGKNSNMILQNAQADYAVAARLLESEFTTPSVSEMDSIIRMWETMIPKVREFDNGFRHLGDREYLRRH